MAMKLIVPLLAAIVATAVSCSRGEPDAAQSTGAPATAPASWTLNIQPVTTPAAADSSEPRLTASDRGVILSWVERSGTKTQLKFAERTASGWTTPLTASSGDNWFISYADPPTVMRRPDGTLVASWLVATDVRAEGSDLHVSYSKDEGKTWARSFLPHHDGTRQQHAFASFVELPGNALGILWLDARAWELEKDSPDGGAVSLRYAAFDPSWKQIADAAIDLRVCECCSTTTAVTSDGVIAAYRDRSDKDIRDISVSRLDNGTWTPGVTVHNDNWEVYACPVNGPMLSARGRQVAVAWFTAKNDQGQAWAAFSNDAGRTWGAPIRLDEGASLGHVGVELLDDGSAVASWIESANRRGQFTARRIDASGARSPAFAVPVVSGRLATSYPRIARHGDELVFAWTESPEAEGGTDSGPKVQTAVAQLPH